MRERARAGVGFTLLGLVGAALVSTTLLAFDCGPPPPPPPTANEVKTIEELVACMDGVLAGKNVTVADAVQCIPPCCSVTLTMSPRSAQAACTLEGGDLGTKCQLPRVLLDCPGPPRLQPSFLLCPVGSGEGDNQGSNRIEVGQDVDDIGSMRMADIVVKPGLYQPPTDFMSKKTADSSGGTKSCNDGCHRLSGTPAIGDDELSQPIDPFGRFGTTDLAPCIISTDACDRKATPGVCRGNQVTAESLSDICGCIDYALGTDAGHPLETPQGRIVQKLCRAFEGYQNQRGICGTDECPTPSGPECPALGVACSPITGGVSLSATGYSCQEVSPGVQQCVSDCMCEAWALEGGGKFLGGLSEVSMVRLELSGKISSEDPTSIDDDTEISGSLSAYEYLTRTLVESIALDTFQATRSGADFTASGSGSALVNGTLTNIEFTATKTGSDVTFAVHDADSSAFLAGGMGEAGRAAFELTVTP